MMLPGERDMKDALSLVGCATYRDLTQQPRAVRDRFHADWTRRMHERCGIDPMKPAAMSVASMTPEEVAELLAKQAEGESVTQLAAHYGLNERAVYRLLQRRGIAPKLRRITPDEEAHLVNLHVVEGLSAGAIAMRSRLALDTVYRVLNRNGIALRVSAEATNARLTALHAEGKTDNEIAEVMGLHPVYLRTRRNALGLAPNSAKDEPSWRVRRTREAHARTMARTASQDAQRLAHAALARTLIHDEGLSYQQAGERMGLTKGRVWQLLNGTPAQNGRAA